VPDAQCLCQRLRAGRGGAIDQPVDGIDERVALRVAHGRRNSNSAPMRTASALPSGGK
jgi:hypothetical protein